MKNDLIKIKLIREQAKDRKMVDDKEVVVDSTNERGEPVYIRDDMSSLQRLLNKFDTSKKQPREWASWAKIRRKVYDAYVDGKDYMNLTVGEASFLRGYLKDFPNEIGKDQRVSDGEVIVRESLLEQLPE